MKGLPDEVNFNSNEITKGKVRRWLSEGRSPKVVLFMLELWERKPELHKMKLKDEKGYPTIDWERSEETIMDIEKNMGLLLLRLSLTDIGGNAQQLVKYTNTVKDCMEWDVTMDGHCCLGNNYLQAGFSCLIILVGGG